MRDRHTSKSHSIKHPGDEPDVWPGDAVNAFGINYFASTAATYPCITIRSFHIHFNINHHNP